MNPILKRNNVNIIGDGEQVMLFAHGFGCDQRSWQFMVNAFTPNHKVVLFDYVGSGESDLSAYSSAKYGSLDGYSQDVLDVCEALSLKQVIFVGHSVSAMIGLLAAIKKPAYFKKLIFIGPSPRYLNDENYVGGFERKDLESLFEFMDSNYLGWSSNMAPVIMGVPDQPHLAAELTESFCRNDPVIARHFAEVTFLSDHRADVSKSTTPALILQCSEDLIAPLTVGQFMHRSMPGSVLRIIDNVGHCPHMSAANASYEAMRQFLAHTLG